MKNYLLVLLSVLVLFSCGGGYNYSDTYQTGEPAQVVASFDNLTTSEGDIGFDPAVDSYTMNVPFGVDSINITPAFSNGVVTVNGVEVASGTPSQDIPLAVGSNVIEVVMTSADGETSTYTINVIRDSSPKEITSYVVPFVHPSTGDIKSLNGTIDQKNHTIALRRFPQGITPADLLLPAIMHTGVSIDPASGVATTYPATYTVTGADGTTQDYLVTLETTWTRLTGVSGQMTQSTSLDVDPDFNVYSVGKIGSSLGFIKKYTSGGNTIWMQMMPGSIPHDVSANSQYVYVAGTKGNQGFISKYKSNGDLVPPTQLIGDPNYTTEINSIKLDSSNNVYIAGNSTGPISGNPAIGIKDAFLQKYGPSGNLIWTRFTALAGADLNINDVNIDESNNVYIVGSLSSWGSVSMLDGQPRISDGDAYVKKYTENGTQVWTRLIGSIIPTSIVQVASVSVDKYYNVYVFGRTTNPLEISHTMVGTYDTFVRKYNSNGVKQWTTKPDGKVTTQTVVVGGGVDSLGNTYISGWSLGSKKSFIKKYNTSGSFTAEDYFGGDIRRTIASAFGIDETDNVYMAGRSNEASGVLEPGENLTGIDDAFVTTRLNDRLLFQ